MINRYYHKIINGALKRCGVRKADTDVFQIAFWWNSNNIFYRRKQNDTWEPWVEFGETMKSINSHLHENKEAQ